PPGLRPDRRHHLEPNHPAHPPSPRSRAYRRRSPWWVRSAAGSIPRTRERPGAGPGLSITSSLLGLGRLGADRVHRGVALRRGLRREGSLVRGGDDGVLAAAGGARLRRVGAVLVALDERGQPRVV